MAPSTRLADLPTYVSGLYKKYGNWTLPTDILPYCRFTHIVNPMYGPNYFCYIASDVVRHDLFQVMRGTGDIMNARNLVSYRKQVLDPGSSKPAKLLIDGFLGREVDMVSFKKWLETEG
jgi:thimet oligopeptidase